MAKMKEDTMTADIFGGKSPPVLPKLPPSIAFDGDTYDSDRDFTRLDTQMGRVYRLMTDGKWRTLSEIANHTGGSEAAVSARLRDFRKEKYGSMLVERVHVSEGLYRYRLVL